MSYNCVFYLAFVAEPTTGLDSKSAMTVLLALRSIASTGRSIVCTIHQPSAELFFMFDSLLLLQPGGKQVYCGPVGHRGAAIKGVCGTVCVRACVAPCTRVFVCAVARVRVLFLFSQLQYIQLLPILCLLSPAMCLKRFCCSVSNSFVDVASSPATVPSCRVRLCRVL